MNNKDLLSKDIQFLAYAGWSPKQIEEKLGFLPYTIHIHHHEDLMIGYLQHIARYDKLPSKISAKKLDMTEEEKIQRKREQVKQSYLKRKAAGTLKRRSRKTKAGRSRLTESEKEKIQKNIEAFHRRYAKNKENNPRR